ncbi:exodeoxyribonuclease VII small subunit [Thalassospira sp.]|uniref:exodeoxyribonuclease VII small subunit n=1 Tax=Thalassospira sp. TaxID=1912094 RepID=UPI0027372A13|nr:exodeoxyribonuclease VII small subunit [Thalassospira sp.]MDP2696843.1 exodeoxyribonuclease VII small subunit [Thalassospira sp.]
MSKATSSAVLPDDIANLSFEEALGQLETLVRQLEQGQIGLDDAIASYERGAALKRHCADKLRMAEERIEKITLDAGGRPTATPTEIE